MERSERWPVALEKWVSQARDNNPYATADSIRAWDAVIRNHVADALEAAAGRWRAWYVEAHRALSVPSREHPLPDRAALEAAKDLARTAEDLSQRAAGIRARETPPQDRVHHRLRSIDTLLDTLIAYDARLAGYVDRLNDLAAPGPLADEPTRRSALLATLNDVDRALAERQEALAPPAPF